MIFQAPMSCVKEKTNVKDKYFGAPPEQPNSRNLGADDDAAGAT